MPHLVSDNCDENPLEIMDVKTTVAMQSVLYYPGYVVTTPLDR